MTAVTKPHRQPYEPGLRDEWRTPPEFVAGIERRWSLALDVAADAYCAVAPRYIDHATNALECDWLLDWKIAAGYDSNPAAFSPSLPVGGLGALWCNPPYSLVSDFVDACHRNAEATRRTVLLLAPSSVGTKWWARAFGLAVEVWHVDARLRFEPPPGIAATSNTAGSTLFVFEAASDWSTPRCGLLDRNGRPVPQSVRAKS